MMRLPEALIAWNTPGFNQVLKAEIEHLDAEALPLQQGLAQGSHANSSFSVTIISVFERSEFICARTGIFYTSIIAGCSCADDPTPVDELSEYCEVEFAISKKTADATVTLLAD